MTIDVEIEVPNAAPKTGDYRLLRSVVTSGALGLVETALPQVLGAMPTRKYGLDAHVTFEYDQDETITLPAGTNDHRAAERGEGREQGHADGVGVHEDGRDDGEVPPRVPAQEPVHRSDRSTRSCAARSRRSVRSRSSP